MAFNNFSNRIENSRQTTMGIGAHDHVVYTYGQGGGTAANNIIQLDYYVGGTGIAGTLVGTVQIRYDSNNLVITKERTA
jgi:hypothetical protein